MSGVGAVLGSSFLSESEKAEAVLEEILQPAWAKGGHAPVPRVRHGPQGKLSHLRNRESTGEAVDESGVPVRGGHAPGRPAEDNQPSHRHRDLPPGAKQSVTRASAAVEPAQLRRIQELASEGLSRQRGGRHGGGGGGGGNHSPRWFGHQGREEHPGQRHLREKFALQRGLAPRRPGPEEVPHKPNRNPFIRGTPQGPSSQSRASNRPTPGPGVAGSRPSPYRGNGTPMPPAHPSPGGGERGAAGASPSGQGDPTAASGGNRQRVARYAPTPELPERESGIEMMNGETEEAFANRRVTQAGNGMRASLDLDANLKFMQKHSQAPVGNGIRMMNGETDESFEMRRRMQEGTGAKELVQFPYPGKGTLLAGQPRERFVGDGIRRMNGETDQSFAMRKMQQQSPEVSACLAQNIVEHPKVSVSQSSRLRGEMISNWRDIQRKQAEEKKHKAEVAAEREERRRHLEEWQRGLHEGVQGRVDAPRDHDRFLAKGEPVDFVRHNVDRVAQPEGSYAPRPHVKGPVPPVGSSTYQSAAHTEATVNHIRHNKHVDIAPRVPKQQPPKVRPTPDHKNRGKVPAYLVRREMELEREALLLQSLHDGHGDASAATGRSPNPAGVPPGARILSEGERRKVLSDLRQRQKELEDHLGTKGPLNDGKGRSVAPAVQQRERHIRKLLADVDLQLERFSRRLVYVDEDWE